MAQVNPLKNIRLQAKSRECLVWGLLFIWVGYAHL